jgi:hypothetical protein
MAQKRAATGSTGAGAIIEAKDGRFYFLTASQVRHARIQRSRAFAAFIKKSRAGGKKSNVRKGGGGRAGALGCRAIKAWLDSHSPNSAKWRRMSLAWGGNC